MAKIFISHSSIDKAAVKRLCTDLRNNDVDVWLDEWEIDVGDNIVQKVQEGLKNATFVAIWLTQNSIEFGWVQKEWNATIYREISDKEVRVLPLLAEDCEIPYFLADKKHADFRSRYQDGLDQILKVLKKN